MGATLSKAHQMVAMLLWLVCTGSIPGELGDLVKLEKLVLKNNKLTGKGIGTHVDGLSCGPGNVLDARTDCVRFASPAADLSHPLTGRVRVPISSGSQDLAFLVEGV